MQEPLYDCAHDAERPMHSQAIRAEIIKNNDTYQAAIYTQKQVFHQNYHESKLQLAIDELFGPIFTQYHAWDGEYEYQAKITKKGKILTSRKKTSNQPHKPNLAPGSFNKQKNYILPEGEAVPALVDMGVLTKDGKIVTAMADKFGQINRFLELLADETKGISHDVIVNIVDFGCGKSYLTFLVYYYFTKIRKLNVNIVGLDLDEHVVKTCDAAAQKYGYLNLQFTQGDIGQQKAPPVKEWSHAKSFNIVISLHACDTATDHALANAITWNADLIYAAPCCQHELKNQMAPQNLKLLARYGIIKERVSALATDAIRANLLEAHGYKARF